MHYITSHTYISYIYIYLYKHSLFLAAQLPPKTFLFKTWTPETEATTSISWRLRASLARAWRAVRTMQPPGTFSPGRDPDGGFEWHWMGTAGGRHVVWPGLKHRLVGCQDGKDGMPGFCSFLFTSSLPGQQGSRDIQQFDHCHGWVGQAVQNGSLPFPTGR